MANNVAYQADRRAWGVIKRWPDADRNASRRAKWRQQGIDVEAAEALFADSDGSCPLCGRTPTHRLHVDHDHGTGRVRGLLCGSCNRAIGLMGDDPARLRAAADYLEKHA